MYTEYLLQASSGDFTPVGMNTIEKRQENSRYVNRISEHLLRGSWLGWAKNLVDRLRTSADERVLSGCRAVVIA
jgi:hypothetical protein